MASFIGGIHPRLIKERVKRRVKKTQKSKHYLILFGVIFVFFVYLIFKNKSFLTGYSIINTVVKTSNLSYILLFVLIGVVFFYIRKK